MSNNKQQTAVEWLQEQYYESDGKLTRVDFEAKLHEQWHNEEHPMRKYVMLVESVKNKINMVDPSGGPCITVGDRMGSFSEEFKGLVVNDIESIDGGYKLITKQR